tara:strand:- start:908 stop:1921 length:1014 start_codon:yes stop_codon:yes gene_type:complete
MPELFQDSFVEATDTNLTSHTPATGTSWTLQVGNSDAMRIESDDNTLRTNNGSLTTLVTSDDLGDTSCYVEATLGDFQTQSNKEVAIRVQDEDNYVAWGIFGTGGGGLRLRKAVGGVLSNLIQTQGAAGVKYRIESEPGVLRFYGDGVQIGSDISDSAFDTETRQGLVTQSSAFGVSWLEDYATGTLGSSGISIAVTEVKSNRIDLSSLSISANLSITTTETRSSRVESSVISVAGNVIATVTEVKSSRVGNSSVTIDVSALSILVTEIKGSRVDLSSIDIKKEIDLIVTEIKASRQDFSLLNIPVIITINPKNIIRVKRKENTVRVKRNSNIIRVK